MLFQNKAHTATVSFIILLAFLLLFCSRATEQTGDSLAYAPAAKTGREMFHPHHLLFTPVVRGLFLAISSMCEWCDVICVGQIHNIMWAIVAVLSFYSVAKCVLDSNTAAMFASILFLVTQGIWQFSTQVEVYVPATGCLALLAARMIRRRDVRLTILDMTVISLLLVVSVLYHQTNILFCIPLGTYLVATQARKARVAAIVLSLAGLIVVSTYTLIFLLTSDGRTPDEFLRFCLSYTFHPNPTWGTFEKFSVVGVSDLVKSQVWNLVAIPLPILHLLRSSTTALAMSLSVIFLLSIVVLSWNIVQIVHRAAHATIRTFLLVWLATYFIFFLWWSPGEREFFVVTLFPLLLLFCAVVKDIAERFGRAHGSRKITSAVIALLTITAVTLNHRDVAALHQSKGPAYRQAATLDRLVPEKCLILTDYIVLKNRNYYFGRVKVIEVQMPLLLFYQHKPVPQWDHVKREECIIVSLSYVAPEYTITGFNAYSHSSEWVAFVEWLFNFEYDSDGTSGSVREFEVITDEKGEAYIVLSASRMKVSGFNELLQALDNRMSLRGNMNVSPFGMWLSTMDSDDE